ncbi:radical SAM family heme chaperone HemW [Dendrosporobacter sp. 1207_IL3150]|uniref:radical SAM family heme chaperone HemW n=1 Tax=Dendrosporobacter sp. 1207_IL3150 TaxID=3084054 RepID=UPI002FD89115
MNLGLYIHIPFCSQKCFYCDFPSYSGLDYLYSDYIAALSREISDRGGLLSDYTVDTVFIGGGTPTILPAGLLENLMENLQKNFNISSNAEISIEANPGTVEESKLKLLRSAGVNRISFGVQSFSNDLLKAIGRIHTAEDAIQSVNLAHRCGFNNINIDLMYGLPNQSLEHLKSSLLKAYDLEIQHLSVYGLKIEEGTLFADSSEKGLLKLPEDSLEDQMYEFVIKENIRHGYDRYEISNFAKCGYECQHNLKYWNFEPYVGLGSAAHSFINNTRQANIRDVRQYIYSLESGEFPLESEERLDDNTAIEEFAFLSLRTVKGLSLEKFSAKFNLDFFEIYKNIINRLEKKRVILIEEGYVRLTPLGMKYGNQVFSEFLR